MTLITVNPDTCLQDGLCARECPAGCIVFEKGQLPVPHEEKYAYCLECGHCVAVCPSGALQLDNFPDEGIPLDRELDVSPEQVSQFLRARRSVRIFKNSPVGRDALEKLLDVTQYAPSGHNARPVRWTVADTPEKVREIATTIAGWMRNQAEQETELAGKLHLHGIVKAWDNGRDMICRNAPSLAVAYGPQQGVTPMQDGVIGITYLELAATGAGLGACWCGYAVLAAQYDESVRRALGVPEGKMVYGSLMIGKPVLKYKYMPPRAKADINWL